jgi:ubiquinone/menaquinone biosynthesis C-methylase UbiE
MGTRRKDEFMPDHVEIYQQHANQYDRMVKREDYQGQLFQQLIGLTPWENLDVIELGAGSGRVTQLLVPLVRSLRAYDASRHMLDQAEQNLTSLGYENWELQTADHRSLPAMDQSADVVISGWSICYLADWEAETWEVQLEKAMFEIRRVLRPGGLIVLLETQGTGHLTPSAPDQLVNYYHYLEREGFETTWFRTDYRFASLEEAHELIGFFFGEDMLDNLGVEDDLVLPECTGMWWKRI